MELGFKLGLSQDRSITTTRLLTTLHLSTLTQQPTTLPKLGLQAIPSPAQE